MVTFIQTESEVIKTDVRTIVPKLSREGSGWTYQSWQTSPTTNVPIDTCVLPSFHCQVEINSDFESVTIELYPFITNKSRGMVNQVVAFELPRGGTIKITGDEEFSLNLTDSPLGS